MSVRPISPAVLANIIPGFIAGRGYHAIYREREVNHCPGCGRAHWHIGRVSAECAFCATAIPLEATFTRGDIRPVIVHKNMRRAA